jgi:hypothetical protein
VPEAERIADVPLTDLLSFLSGTDAARMADAATLLDELPEPITRSPWSWLLPEEDAPQRPVLETILTLQSTGTDWLEIWLDIEPSSVPDMLAIYTAIEVACWCPTDHNMHAVHEQHWLAASGPALATAFETAIAAVRSWAADSQDPNHYRQRAGLPEPPSSDSLD